MADKGDDASGSSSELIVANVPDQRPLVCIEYPGFVDNVDRALASLGGIETISRVLHEAAHYEKNHGLEVRLRPEDLYCKPALAHSIPVTNMVLRVRRRRRRQRKGGGVGEGDSEGGGEPECSVEVLGLVNHSYEFTGMADYQVLPPGLSRVSHNADTVDPSLFQITEPFDDTFRCSAMPLFLPPRIFSKFDKPSNYAARPDFQPKVTENQMPGKSRQRRQVFAVGIPFNHKDPIPSQPHPDAPNTNHPKLHVVKQLFQERPVWSRNGIQSRIKMHSAVARSLLAFVSYYFTSGPWKTLWVRLGYDPRSSPSSKVYQCLDYRMPKDITVVSTTDTRRGKHKLRAAPHPQEKKRMFQLTRDQDSVRQAEEVWADGLCPEAEDSPVFTTERLPSQRQMYYQLCDLRDDSLQAIVHANDGREHECTETNGWCEEGAYDQLRKTLGELIRKTAERIRVEQQLTEHTAAASTSQT